MKKYYLCFGLASLTVSGFGQSVTHDVLSPGGGVSQTDVIRIEWTLGEVAVASHVDDQRMITEGFHQPLLQVEEIIDAGEGKPEHDRLNPIMEYKPQVFPNPTSGEITIRLPSPHQTASHFLLLAPAGEVVGQFMLPALHTEGRLDLTALPSGIYVLKMIQDKEQIPVTFRITKMK